MLFECLLPVIFNHPLSILKNKQCTSVNSQKTKIVFIPLFLSGILKASSFSTVSTCFIYPPSPFFSYLWWRRGQRFWRWTRPWQKRRDSWNSSKRSSRGTTSTLRSSSERTRRSLWRPEHCKKYQDVTCWLHAGRLKSHAANGCLVSAVSFEREAKSKQEKNAEIKKLTAEIGTIKK